MRKLRFFSSIQTKFALTYFSAIAFVLVMMNTFFLVACRNMIFQSKQVFVESQAALIANHLEEAFDTLTVEGIATVVAQLDVAGVTYVVITDVDGGVLYGPTGAADNAAFTAQSFRIVRRALEGYDVFYARFSDGTFSSSAARPVFGAGGAIGAVYVHDDDAEQGMILIDMQDTLRNISIVVVVFSLFMVALIAMSVMRRVRSVINAIISVREGEYSYHIKMSGSDELALLSDEFNRLTVRLRETDEIRRRFVADASHELKTPLASIRLLSDSILQNEDIGRETVQEFISDIGMEAERLTRTTGKLMTLTRLDSQILDEYARVDMREAVIATLRMLGPLAESRRLTLSSDLAEGCFIFATEDSVHQIIFNLVENAIKYNKPDGSLHVRLRVDYKTVVLNVDDRGVGVPGEDLPYIFDRFYRVDKARSREAGGSGLGLSIVWDTVRELGGKVTASNRVGGGMRFQVRFDLYDG